MNLYTLEPWTTQVRTAWVHLYKDNVIVSLPYPWVSHLLIQPATRQKHYFWSMIGNPWMWKADRMHGSTPFYIQDLSIRGFWCPLRSWPPQIPKDDWVLGESKLNTDFSTGQGSVPQSPASFKVQFCMPSYEPIAIQVANSDWRNLGHPWHSGVDNLSCHNYAWMPYKHSLSRISSAWYLRRCQGSRNS